ncbi:MAG: hypothetical protein VW238_05875 [Nitrosomonadales bacterium]
MFSNLHKYFFIALFLLSNQVFADHHDGHENCHDGDNQTKHEWVKKHGEKCTHDKCQENMKAIIKECLDGATIENNKIKINC